MADEVEVFLVDRAFSDDELNLLILTYATADGRLEHRRERAVPVTGSTGVTIRDRLLVSPDDLTPVTDPEVEAWYREQARRVRDESNNTSPKD